MWKVVDNDFNRANYPALVGRVFPHTKGHAVVEDVGTLSEFDFGWRHNVNGDIQQVEFEVSDHSVVWWHTQDETESGIYVDGVPYHEAHVEVLASIMAMLDLGRLLDVGSDHIGPYHLRIVDAFGDAVELAVQRFLADNQAT